MPFPYGLQRVTLHNPLVDDDLAHLDTLDHLQDGGGYRGGVDALDGILDLGGGEHLGGVPQKVRDGLDKRRIFGGTLLGGLGVTACVLLVHLLDGGGGKLPKLGGKGLIGGDSLIEYTGIHSFFVSFLVFKGFRSLISKVIISKF